MSRAIWKGAISFGLVHVPVSLHSAATDSGVDFDWIDQRSMDPVGYKRINKRTGKEVPKEDIVRGVKAESGDYVVLSDDEIRAAYPKTTQTIAIEGFIQASELSFVYLEKPYYLEPSDRGEKVYALLRDAMADAGVIGIARVVMHTKEHLAALAPAGKGLVLNTLRWPSDLRAMDDLDLPAGGRDARPKDTELRMAKQLIGDMTTKWDPAQYADRFTQSVHALVAQRVAAGKTEKVESLEGEAPATSSNVIDLTELLRKSLGERKGAARKATEAPASGPAPKSTAKAASKAASKSASKSAPAKTNRAAEKPVRKTAARKAA